MYLLNAQTRRQEMFELIHILGNGNVMWYPSSQSPVYSIPGMREMSPSIGNVQPLMVECDKNKQLCHYLKTHQAPAPQLPISRSYADYAYGRSKSGVPPQSLSAYPPFNSTW